MKEVGPMAEKRESWAGRPALYGIVASVAAGGLVALYCRPHQTDELRIVLLAAAGVLILAGSVLAVVGLVRARRRGRAETIVLAVIGLGVNGLGLSLGCAGLLPVLARAAWMRNPGYTREEMRAMPRVIPGSRVILNEDLGFRLEVPRGFPKNQAPQPRHVLYSFGGPDPQGMMMWVDIVRLGARIDSVSPGPEYYDSLRGRLPPEARFEPTRVSWKTHELVVFRVPSMMGGRDWCTWGVQVPLAREAIQVTVSGQPQSGAECQKLLARLLTGLQGLSNWDSPSVPMARAKSLRPGPRVGHAAETPAASAGAPAEPPVAAGHSEIRTFPGLVPKIPERNSKLIYEFDLSLEPALIHVPANYDGSTPFGLIVFLPGDGSFTAAPRGWEEVLEERKLLFVSPQKAYNSRHSDQRCGLAVVCALKMGEQYKIDPRRVYVAGYSGGGRMASRLGYYHPDLFSGTIQSCGSDFHRPVLAVKTVPLERDRRSPYGLLNASPGEIKVARRKVRFVIITGPGDFRYGHLWDIYDGGFIQDGFQARLIDDPWMDHVTCGPHALRQALDFIEQGRRP
jgi:hypothetical protein